MFSALQKFNLLFAIFSSMKQTLQELRLTKALSELKLQKQKINILETIAQALEDEKTDNKIQLQADFNEQYAKIEQIIKKLSSYIFIEKTLLRKFLSVFILELDDEDKLTPEQVIKNNIFLAKKILNEASLQYIADIIKADMKTDPKKTIIKLVEATKHLATFEVNEFKEYTFYNYRFKNFSNFIKVLEFVITDNSSHSQLHQQNNIQLLGRLAEIFIQENNTKLRKAFLQQENIEENNYLRQSSTITSKILYQVVVMNLNDAVENLATDISPYLKHAPGVTTANQTILFHVEGKRHEQLRTIFFNFFEKLLQFLKTNPVIVESILEDLKFRDSKIDIKKVIIFSLIYPLVETLIQELKLKNKDRKPELFAALSKNLCNAFYVLFGFYVSVKNKTDELMCCELQEFFSDENFRTEFNNIFPQTRRRSNTCETKTIPKLNFNKVTNADQIQSPRSVRAESVNIASLMWSQNNINTNNKLPNNKTKSALDALFLYHLKSNAKLAANLLANTKISAFVEQNMSSEEFSKIKNTLIIKSKTTATHAQDEVLISDIDKLIVQLEQKIAELSNKTSEENIDKLTLLQELLPIRQSNCLKGLRDDAFKKMLITLLEQKVENNPSYMRVLTIAKDETKKNNDEVAYRIWGLFQEREHAWSQAINKLPDAAEIIKLQNQKELLENFKQLLDARTNNKEIIIDKSLTNSPRLTI